MHIIYGFDNYFFWNPPITVKRWKMPLRVGRNEVFGFGFRHEPFYNDLK